LPDSSWHNVPKRGKLTHNITNGLKMYQMAVKYSKWPENKPAFSIPRPFKIYLNRDFWFENIASGNPVLSSKVIFNGRFLNGFQVENFCSSWELASFKLVLISCLELFRTSS
jgi:hypothetical protein